MDLEGAKTIKGVWQHRQAVIQIDNVRSRSRLRCCGSEVHTVDSRHKKWHVQICGGRQFTVSQLIVWTWPTGMGMGPYLLARWEMADCSMWCLAYVYQLLKFLVIVRQISTKIQFCGVARSFYRAKMATPFGYPRQSFNPVRHSRKHWRAASSYAIRLANQSVSFICHAVLCKLHLIPIGERRVHRQCSRLDQKTCPNRRWSRQTLRCHC